MTIASHQAAKRQHHYGFFVGRRISIITITVLMLVLLAVAQTLNAVTSETFEDGDGSDDWSKDKNWTNDTSPNGIGDEAYFVNADFDDVNVDEAVVLGHLTLTGNTAWVMATDAGQGFDFNDTDDEATLITGGTANHNIQVDVLLTDDLVWSTSGTGSSIISGDISGQGPADGLTVDGTGTANLTGALTFEGDYVVDGATLNRNGGDNDIFLGETAGDIQRLTVINGGDLNITDDFFMSEFSDTTTSAFVDGAGSTVTIGDISNIGEDGTASITIQGGGSWVQSGNMRIGMGDTATGDGAVTVTGNGSSLSINGGADLIVGNQAGNGLLVVSNTATVTTDQLRIGDDASSSGDVTITSGGSLTASGDIYVGDANTGNMVLSSGALLTNTATTANFIVGRLAGSIGSADINGAGTTALLDTVKVGDASANANELVVSNTATVTAADDFYIGEDAGSFGRMTVESGADITSNDILWVGYNGSGYLTIDGSGSTFTANSNGIRVGETATGVGAVTISNGGDLTTSGWADIGQSGNGEMVITGSGSAYNVSSILLIGENSGGNGSVTVEAGGLLNKTGAANIVLGENTGAIGSMVITGDGSTATIASTLVIGDGSASDNMVVASNSATILMNGTSTTGSLIIGDDANSNGSMTVASGASVTIDGSDDDSVGHLGTGRLIITGSNTTFDVDADVTWDDFNVGRESGSHGFMELSAGATFTHTSVGANNAYFAIGREAGSIGSMNVTGAGTTGRFTIMTVGKESTSNNALHVSNTATVSVGQNLFIGGQGGTTSNGIITVSTGADLVVGGTTFLGNEDTGTMTIDGTGTTFTTNALSIGVEAGSDGTLSITSGADVNVTAQTDVGASGTGTMVINGAGSTFAGATVNVGSDGTLDIENNATLSATTLDVSGTVNLSTADGIISGTDLQLSGGTFNVSVDNALGGIDDLTLTANSVIDMNGTTDLFFDSIVNGTWTGTLSIWSWDGTANQTGTSGSDDRLIFDTDPASFTKLTQIAFYDDNGGTFLGRGTFIDLGNGTWELVPVPEPSTYFFISMICATALWHERRRIRRLILKFRRSPDD